MSISTTHNDRVYNQKDLHERHFRTDHLKKDLKSRSVRGGAVTLGSQALKFIIQMGSTMVLARLLTPSDFGIVAMVLAITGFVSMFKDAGLSMATIQRAEINHAQISTLFWINVAISAFLMLITAALAPAIVWFYKEPRLFWITIATAGTYIFSGITIQHQALLRRQMRFHALAVIEIISMASGVIAAIVMAFYTKSYWSLVLMPASSAAINALLVWIYCDWKPGLPQRNSGVRPMLTFGANMMAGTVLWYLNRNIYSIFIGRALGPELLGFFTKAQNLMIMMLKKVNSPLYSVSFPALSSLQQQPERFRQYYKKAIGTMAIVSMPIAVMLTVGAEHVVLIMLGEQWKDCIPLCRALGPAAFLGTISLAIACVIIPLGKPDREWKLKAVAFVLHFIAILIGLKWGVLGVVIALSITEIVYFLPSNIFAFRRTPIKMIDLWASTWHAAIASIVSGLIIWNIIHSFSIFYKNVIIGFSLCTLCYSIAYLCSLLILPGGVDKVKSLIGLTRLLRNR